MRSDIAIVGAGPAGAWAAYCLARRGARVTIFDPSHPREKPCGGGITGRALGLVSRAIDASRLSTCVVARARFIDSDCHREAVVPFDVSPHSDRALVVASRADFDAVLLAAACEAGAKLVRARTADLAVESGGVVLDTTNGRYRADFVVGADGANSLVRRRLLRPFDRRDLSVATGYFARGVTSAEIVVELVAHPAGYIWSFPRPDHLAIGICAQADSGATAEALRHRTANWVATTGVANGARLEAYSWPIPSLGAASLERLEVYGPRWAVIGDAAGLVDPITREGIYFALLSGQRLAEALTTGRADHYGCRIRDEVVPELARAARFKAGFFRTTFTGLTIHALRESAAIRAVMADLIAGRQPYLGLKRRLLNTLEIRLAWQLLLSGRRTHPAL